MVFLSTTSLTSLTMLTVISSTTQPGTSSSTVPSTTVSSSTILGISSFLTVPTGGRHPVTGSHAYTSLVTGATGTPTLLATPVSSIALLGDGSRPPWPTSVSDWVSWPDLWRLYDGQVGTWCAVPNTKDDVRAIKAGIELIALQCGVDPRLIFSVIMSESSGCVHIPSTVGAVVNPGLMQSHSGMSCAGSNACSDQDIAQMILDGTCGDSDNTLALMINKEFAAGFREPVVYYRAFRGYNTGQNFNITGPLEDVNLPGAVATGNPASDPNYVSKNVNRLRGWVG